MRDYGLIACLVVNIAAGRIVEDTHRLWSMEFSLSPWPRTTPRPPRNGDKNACAILLAALALSFLPPPLAAQERAAPPRFHSRAIRVQPLDPVGDRMPAPWLTHGPTTSRPIASISKLMALMVVLDRDLERDGLTKVIASDHRWTRSGARSRLAIGHAYRNRDLVTAALMSSDNRAVMALGRAVGLPRADFASAMNRKAQKLGLKRSRFKEPTGLSYGNVSSPEGVLITLRAALDYPPIRAATSANATTIRPAGRPRSGRQYVNTNRLVRWGVPGILGGKTGYNRKAGHCLTFAMEVDGQRVGVAILGAPSRERLFRDAKVIAQWIPRESRRRQAESP